MSEFPAPAASLTADDVVAPVRKPDDPGLMFSKQFATISIGPEFIAFDSVVTVTETGGIDQAVIASVASAIERSAAGQELLRALKSDMKQHVLQFSRLLKRREEKNIVHYRNGDTPTAADLSISPQRSVVYVGSIVQLLGGRYSRAFQSRFITELALWSGHELYHQLLGLHGSKEVEAVLAPGGQWEASFRSGRNTKAAIDAEKRFVSLYSKQLGKKEF